QPDVGQERAGQQRHVFARHEFLGHAHRIARRAAVIPRDDLQALSVDATRLVDLVDGQLPALLVGLEKGRNGLVAVDLTDLDRLLGPDVTNNSGPDQQAEDESSEPPHDDAPYRFGRTYTKVAPHHLRNWTSLAQICPAFAAALIEACTSAVASG